jgi:hypothetical protein
MHQVKSLRRNIIPSFAAVASHTYTSAAEQALYGKGIRLYVTISASATSGGNDTLNLCAVPPGTTTPVALVGFTAASLLSTNGTFMFDFYPGAWLPASGLSASGGLKGAAGVELPGTWAVQLVTAAGSSGTIQVDAELLP